jgi:hypothetical protein
MDGILKELELIRQQKEAVQDQLQAMEKARRVKKGAPGMGDGVDEGGVAKGLGVRKGVAMDSLKFHLSPPCPTLLCPAGGPPPNRPYSRFRGGPPAGRAA